MSDFQTTCQTLVNLDPYKRVNYVNGLVLGVDEFVQEQIYHLAKHRLHNRALHGYGTVCGLTVSQRATPQGPEIIVGPGLAVNPQGLEMRLAEAHCAVLNHWLQRNRDRLQQRFGSPPVPGSPASLSLYLVLCYRECKTDRVPIPSGPCQSLEDSSAPSRIADAFELALRFDPPDQTEEDAVRELVALLGQIEISDAPGGLTQDEIENLVRNLIDTGSPTLGSPPGGPLFMHPDQARALLGAALRVWVTEVRPQLLPTGRNCASGPPDEACILLAELRFEIDITSGDDFEVAGEVAIIEEQRPYLLHTRLLQEWLLRGGARMADAPPAISDDHGALQGLADDDHPQYLLADGSRALTGDLSAGGNRIGNLAAATSNGDAVRFEQAVKVNDAAGGDLGNTYPNPVVQRLQGRSVADVAPQNGQVLTWNANIGAGRWEPQTAPAGGGDFVDIPPGIGPYAIVAAGMFDAGGRNLSRSFNNLRAAPVSPGGDYLLSFPGYRSPSELAPNTRVYIVKGTVIDGIDPRGVPGVFQFVRFESGGLRVRVLSAQGGPARREFMVEISAYGRPPPIG